MKTWIIRTLSLSLGAALVLTTVLPQDAEAKRLGGSRSQGMQRDMPARTAPDAPPAKPAQPAQGGTPGTPAAAAAGTAAAGTAAAAAGKRSWLGPIAGLAAGLGLVALFSSMGLGAGLANFVMLALMGVAAFFLVRFLMARFGSGARRNGPALATAAAGSAGSAGNSNAMRREAPVQREMIDERPAAFKPAPPAGAPLAPVAVADAPASFAPADPVAASGPAVTAAFVPASFDSESFERIAKMIFIRMQTANDASDLNDLRRFTTPEMFAAVRLDIQDRNGAAQTTDVQKVDAQVLDVAEEEGRQIVSVRFTGLVVEEADAAPVAFREVWHLVKDDGSADSAWAIAGIEQMPAA